MPKNPHSDGRISRWAPTAAGRIIAAMETLSAARAEAERSVRIGRVKFVALVLEDEPQEPSRLQAPASCFQRLLRLIRHLASRVDGRPVAARP